MLLKHIYTFIAKFAENNDEVNVHDTTQTEDVMAKSCKKAVPTEEGAVKETTEENIALQDGDGAPHPTNFQHVCQLKGGSNGRTGSGCSARMKKLAAVPVEMSVDLWILEEV